MFEHSDQALSAGENMVQDGDIIESFGQYLKREREFRNVPLEEIAAYTRIKLRALEAIERDDFSQLPPLAFIRAFIRCYADYLGLNINEVMLNFDAFIQQRFPEMTGEIKKTPRKQQPKQNYLPLAIIIAAVIAVLLIFWLTRTPDPFPGGVADSGTEQPAPDDTSPTHTMFDTPGRTATSNGERPPEYTQPSSNTTSPDHSSPDGGDAPGQNDDEYEDTFLTSRYPARLGPGRELAVFPGQEEKQQDQEQNDNGRQTVQHRVSLTVSQKCWIQYEIDRDEPRAIILKPGQNVTFEGQQSVKITIGNPDGVKSVTYNQHPFDFDPQCAPWHLNFPSTPDDNQCSPR